MCACSQQLAATGPGGPKAARAIGVHQVSTEPVARCSALAGRATFAAGTVDARTGSRATERAFAMLILRTGSGMVNCALFARAGTTALAVCRLVYALGLVFAMMVCSGRGSATAALAGAAGHVSRVTLRWFLGAQMPLRVQDQRIVPAMVTATVHALRTRFLENALVTLAGPPTTARFNAQMDAVGTGIA